jgi:hypothetical protein
VIIASGLVGLALMASNVSAQGNLDKFVVKGETARKALSKTEICCDTAGKNSEGLSGFRRRARGI